MIIMKKVGIIANTTKKETTPFACEVASWLLEKGCQPFISSEVDVPSEFQSHSCDQDDMFAKCDFIVILGGDGTMLNTASLSAMHDVPLLGINMGRLGYLTDVDVHDAFCSLEKVLKGEYKEEKRMMLDVQSNVKPDINWVSLNDVVVMKGSSHKMITAEIWINEKYIDTYRADGFIISTPTGSTAYNLSAGGPIIKPTVETIIITLICAHLIYERPYVISADDIVSFVISGETENAVVVIDGQNVAELCIGDKITASKSEYYTRIMRTTSLEFYDILRRKMMLHHD